MGIGRKKRRRGEEEIEATRSFRLSGKGRKGEEENGRRGEGGKGRRGEEERRKRRDGTK
jgi:hypothetical protein